MQWQRDFISGEYHVSLYDGGAVGFQRKRNLRFQHLPGFYSEFNKACKIESAGSQWDVLRSRAPCYKYNQFRDVLAPLSVAML